jgi:hypothetical protein
MCSEISKKGGGGRRARRIGSSLGKAARVATVDYSNRMGKSTPASSLLHREIAERRDRGREPALCFFRLFDVVVMFGRVVEIMVLRRPCLRPLETRRAFLLRTHEHAFNIINISSNHGELAGTPLRHALRALIID